MADGIRGKDYLNFTEGIKKGILLHRNIDTFTDAHPIFRKSKHRLHENYGHYSGVIIDIFYDHFLAKNWTVYSNEKLHDFTQTFYQLLEHNFDVLTQKTQKMLPYMMQYNWLESYQTLDGIEKILIQMDARTKNQSKMRFSIAELNLYYINFEQEFTSFFEEITVFTTEKLKTL